MKKVLLILSCMIITHSAFAESLFLISFPRSGSSWMMYVIQYLTQQPWDVGNKKQIFPPLKQHVDEQLRCNYRSHFLVGKRVSRYKNRVNSSFVQDNKLILILRNYRECTLRHYLYNYQDALRQFDKKNKSSSNYFTLIEQYDAWNPEKRLLVFYEDLMLNPEEEITRLSKFIEADPKRTKDFLSNLAQHIADSFAQKRTPTDSKGKDMIYHSKKMSYDELLEMDRLVEMNFPKYWNEYLSRYSVENTMK